jgi:hypothetical protein
MTKRSQFVARRRRLRRATAIESGLFKIQAKHLLQFRQRRQAHQEPPNIIDSSYRTDFAAEERHAAGRRRIQSQHS